MSEREEGEITDTDTNTDTNADTDTYDEIARRMAEPIPEPVRKYILETLRPEYLKMLDPSNLDDTFIDRFVYDPYKLIKRFDGSVYEDFVKYRPNRSRFWTFLYFGVEIDIESGNYYKDTEADSISKYFIWKSKDDMRSKRAPENLKLSRENWKDYRLTYMFDGWSRNQCIEFVHNTIIPEIVKYTNMTPANTDEVVSYMLNVNLLKRYFLHNNISDFLNSNKNIIKRYFKVEEDIQVPELSDTSTPATIKVNNELVNDFIAKKCLNENPILLEPFNSSDITDLMYIHLKNSQNVFERASCVSINDLKTLLNSQADSNPTNVMAIYKNQNRYDDYDDDQYMEPTNKVFVRIPSIEIFVSEKSTRRMLNETNKFWYALPMYGGKRRRIGNLYGEYTSSSNHGQVPGFILYKVYTAEEILSDQSTLTMYNIKNNLYAKEDADEFSLKGEFPFPTDKTSITNTIRRLVSDMTTRRLGLNEILEELKRRVVMDDKEVIGILIELGQLVLKK